MVDSLEVGHVDDRADALDPCEAGLHASVIVDVTSLPLVEVLSSADPAMTRSIQEMLRAIDARRDVTHGWSNFVG